MAGEWIKMAVGLRTHPKVVRMATMLKADRLRVVGGLHAVWGLFDTHSVDGHLDGYTAEVMDADLGWKGFTAAMVAIGWLVETDDGLAAPDYEEHNGPNAKRRAMETSRKGRSRKASAECPHESDDESGQVSASHADKMRNREEKKREEEKKEQHPPTPQGVGCPGFDAFWAAWPKSPRKGGKAECERVWRQKSLEAQAAAILAHVTTLARSDGWTKQGGEYVPAPVVYLRGKRWDGAELDGIKAGPAKSGFAAEREAQVGRWLGSASLPGMGGDFIDAEESHHGAAPAIR